MVEPKRTYEENVDTFQLIQKLFQLEIFLPQNITLQNVKFWGGKYCQLDAMV